MEVRFRHLEHLNFRNNGKSSEISVIGHPEQSNHCNSGKSPEISVIGHPKQFKIETVYTLPDGTEFRQPPEKEIVLTVTGEGARCSVETTNGSIRIMGDCDEARTTNGNVHVSGSVKSARTTNGNISGYASS